MEQFAGAGDDSPQAGVAPEVAAAVQEQLEQEARVNWLLVNAILFIVLRVTEMILGLLLTPKVIWLLSAGYLYPRLSCAASFFATLATVICEATSVSIIYYVYNTLEEEAFESFEETFPPDEEGMGDARRGPAPTQKRVSMGRLMLFLLQLPFLLIILHDLNRGINYLGRIISTKAPRIVRAAVFVALSLVNIWYKILPGSILMYLRDDQYSQDFFVPYGEISPCTWIRMILGLLVLVFWKLRLSRRPAPFVPDERFACEVFLVFLNGINAAVALEELAFLGRWRRLTGRAQRRGNDVVQMQPDQQQPLPPN